MEDEKGGEGQGERGGSGRTFYGEESEADGQERGLREVTRDTGRGGGGGV
jgi:hypothetical protein